MFMKYPAEYVRSSRFARLRKVSPSATAILMVAVALAGCVDGVSPLGGAGRDSVNTPPVLSATIWPLEGVSPYDGFLNISYSDAEGGLLSVTVDYYDPSGQLTARTSGGGGGGHEPGYHFEEQIPQRAYAPGTHIMDITVSDEQGAETNLRLSHVVLSNQTAFLDYNGSVAEHCNLCHMYPPPLYYQLGGDGCWGFVREQNGSDCLWWTLPEGAWGLWYDAMSDAQDVGIEFRDVCEPGLDHRVEIDSGHDGDEKGIVPTGARCVILWDTESAPALLRFVVHNEGRGDGSY